MEYFATEMSQILEQESASQLEDPLFALHASARVGRTFVDVIDFWDREKGSPA